MELDVWINAKYCTNNKLPVSAGGFVKVKIPEHCSYCLINNVILSPGSEFIQTSFADCCSHYATYPKVWKNRIKSSEEISQMKPLPDPTLMHCDKCGYPNNYGIPNVGDKYVCGSCR